MNQKKSKQLRRSLGFHPAHPRQYESDRPGTRIGRDMQGKPAVIAVPGTVKATGSRREYQNVKRTPGMANILLRSA